MKKQLAGERKEKARRLTWTFDNDGTRGRIDGCSIFRLNRSGWNSGRISPYWSIGARKVSRVEELRLRHNNVRIFIILEVLELAFRRTGDRNRATIDNRGGRSNAMRRGTLKGQFNRSGEDIVLKERFRS